MNKPRATRKTDTSEHAIVAIVLLINAIALCLFRKLGEKMHAKLPRQWANKFPIFRYHSKLSIDNLYI